MSNEELVALIQSGAPERMGELWEQVKPFIIRQARRVPLEGRGDVDLDDLIQSGYLALNSAVADYKPGEYVFLTHLTYHLKTAFAETTRFRSLRQQRETLAGALSLNAPITDEANAGTLGDLQEDPAGVAALEDVEEQIYRTQLQEAVAAVMADLPEDQQELLRLRFWDGLTLSKVGQLQGVGPECVRQKENKAIRELRKPRNAVRLRPFCDFDLYNGVGLGAFQSTGMSIQERYLVIEEDRKERAEQRRKEREEKQRKERFQSEYEEIMGRAMQEAKAKVARMTPEEKRTLLEKYGYA